MSLVKTLRRRWALLCAALTGAVVLALCAAGFTLAARQLETAGALVFQTQAASLTARLQADGSVDDAWLAQFETENSLCIFLWDGGRPLRFSGGWMDAETRTALLASALENAAAAGFSLRERPAFPSRTGLSARVRDAQYKGLAASWPAGSGWASCVVLRPLAPQRSALAEIAVRYALLCAAALAALCCIAWRLAGRAVRPIAQSMERQEAFLAAASHELRSPLAVISASAQQLQSPQDAPHGETIRAEAARMARLVSDLLLLAGGGAQTWTLHPVRLDADALAADAYARFAPVAAQCGVRLRAQLPDAPLPPLCGDGERLQQLLAILLQNALEHTPAGGTVTLEAAPAPRRGVVFRVRDTGPGVPDTEKEKIFERFYRADGSRADKEHFGLGLAVARELAGLHGGSLRVQDAPEGGACFVLTLPGARP